MLVSKKALSGIRVGPVEDESWREGTPQLAQGIQRALTAMIAADLKGAAARHPNLDAVAFFQFKSLDDRGRQTNRQAVSPPRNLHRPPWIYVYNCISSG